MRTQSVRIALAIALLCPFVSAQWVRTSLDSCSVTCFAISGTNLFAGTLSGVFLSMDGGSSWTAVNSGLGCEYVWDLAVGKTNLFAATAGLSPKSCGGVYLSTNNGTNWTLVNGSIRNGALAVSGTDLFAGFLGDVMLSTDNGTSWTAVNNGLTGAHVNALCVDGTNLLAGTYGGVCRSTNNGISWTAAELANTDVQSFAVSGTNLFAGTYNAGVFLSTNNGSNWAAVNIGLTNQYGRISVVHAFAVSGTNLLAGTDDGVFLSTNNGMKWRQVNAALTDTIVYSLVVSGTNLFAGTSSGVWRRPLSEMTTALGDVTSVLPNDFLLHQNFPNPFNPSTTIRYGLPNRVHVTLSVFNALGQQVAVLQNGEQEAGYHQVQFDGTDLSSGVYFYRLKTGDLTQTKRLMLLK
jgi:hypothetical protein